MNACARIGVAVGITAIAVITAVGPLRPASASGPPQGVELVGMSVPHHIAAIGAEQSGTIVEMTVLRGDRIVKGDVLFRLSNRLEQLEVDRLQALVDSQIEYERASANLEHAKKKAQRVRTLSQQEISAESKVLEVELESELARLSLGKVEFERTQLRNELLQAEERLARRTLHSPLNGVVTKRFKQLGETPEKLEPVVEVMSLDPLWVQFECPVAQERTFPLGSFVSVKPSIGEYEPRLAKIIDVSLQASVAGHTFSITAALANEDYSWRSGLKMIVVSVPDPQAKPQGGK